MSGCPCRHHRMANWAKHHGKNMQLPPRAQGQLRYCCTSLGSHTARTRVTGSSTTRDPTQARCPLSCAESKPSCLGHVAAGRGAQPGCSQSPKRATTPNSTTGGKIALLKPCLVLRTEWVLLVGAQENGHSLQQPG